MYDVKRSVEMNIAAIVMAYGPEEVHKLHPLSSIANDLDNFCKLVKDLTLLINTKSCPSSKSLIDLRVESKAILNQQGDKMYLSPLSYNST